jgi:hypothetical protein
MQIIAAACSAVMKIYFVFILPMQLLNPFTKKKAIPVTDLGGL